MDKQDERSWREVVIEGLEPVETNHFITNIVSSTRYTWLTLIPKNLFEQFQRSANIWFLIVSVFQLSALQFDPKSSWSTIAPLCILLAITLGKDAYNMYYQVKDDNSVNYETYQYWDGSMFKSIQCKNILVGYFLKISEGRKIPADMILVFTSSNDSNIYVDTSDTTGESNLKVKKVVADIQTFCNSVEIEVVMKKLVGIIKFEQPNSDYNTFNAKMHIEKYPKAIDLCADNMLFRGNAFYGSEWIIGIVLYTGIETKIYLNTKPSKKKISQMERRVNIWVIYILLILLAVILFSILATSYLSTEPQDSAYMNFMLLTVLYNNIIPISLFVTMDIVRALQVYFIRHETGKEIKFNISDINENMGQIEYILADKTGTVTENKLKLQSCIIDYNLYQRDAGYEPIITQMDENLNTEKKKNQHSPEQAHFSQNFYSIISKSSENKIIYNFLTCMIVCNTVYPSNGKYLGTSPDEVALIETALELGIKLISRTTKNCKIEWKGEIISYEILAQQGFTEENKISRTLIKNSKNQGILFEKAGWEEAEENVDVNIEDRIYLTDNLNQMKNQGLRTMILLYKELNSDELDEFELRLESARSFPVNCEARVAELFPSIEFNLEVLGITGIEEIVSKETEECVKTLKKAGLKIWLLSGDSETNTICTAQRSGIFIQDINIFRINKIKTELQCIKMMKRAIEHLIFHEDNDSISHVIRYLTRKSTIMRKEVSFHDYHEQSSENNSLINASEEALSTHPIFSKMSNHDSEISKLLSQSFVPENLNYSLSIDKVSLRTALIYPETRKLLVCLLICADSVAFHGLLPHDKATVARLLIENLTLQSFYKTMRISPCLS